MKTGTLFEVGLASESIAHELLLHLSVGLRPVPRRRAHLHSITVRGKGRTNGSDLRLVVAKRGSDGLFTGQDGLRARYLDHASFLRVLSCVRHQRPRSRKEKCPGRVFGEQLTLGPCKRFIVIKVQNEHLGDVEGARGNQVSLISSRGESIENPARGLQCHGAHTLGQQILVEGFTLAEGAADTQRQVRDTLKHLLHS